MNFTLKQNITTRETAVFGAGCFWSVETIFKCLKGVIAVVPGYADGDGSPTYDEVSKGLTGYAEVVKVEFDPTVISYVDLIDVFFNIHNSTLLNQQGSDVGSQYRSIILYTSEQQKETAQQVVDRLEAQEVFDRPIVTEIKQLVEFFPAEGYHQNYYEKNKSQAYCQLVIGPKLKGLEQKFSHLLGDRSS